MMKDKMEESGGDVDLAFPDAAAPDQPKFGSTLHDLEEGLLHLDRLFKAPRMESPPITVTPRKPAAPINKNAAAKNTIKALSAQRARNKTRRD